MDWKRLGRLAAFTVFASTLGGLALVFGGIWIGTSYVLHTGCQGERASLPPDSYQVEAVEFQSRYGTLLRGWFTRGEEHPEIAIIILPGHAGNTWAVLTEARILTDAGFSTLIFEHRSCADPGLIASSGYFEAQDMLGAVDYLRSRPGVEHIGGMGLSEGGTATILAAAEEPTLEAVIPIGGYADLEDTIMGGASAASIPDWVARSMVLTSFWMQMGVHPSESSPISVIGDISPRPVLLIYGEYEAGDGKLLYAAAREPKQLWIVPGAGHMEYYAAGPEEYARRLIAFFAGSFDVSID